MWWYESPSDTSTDPRLKSIAPVYESDMAQGPDCGMEPVIGSASAAAASSGGEQDAPGSDYWLP